MEEKILVKSENEKNYFITIGVAILVGGFLLSTIFGLDSIAYCMYPWSFSFYYVWPSIILIVAGFIYNGSEIVITDKRAYSRTCFIYLYSVERIFPVSRRGKSLHFLAE